jgi:hypothetical protein
MSKHPPRDPAVHIDPVAHACVKGHARRKGLTVSAAASDLIMYAMRRLLALDKHKRRRKDAANYLTEEAEGARP